jgi:sensor histidine kinase regulating citrate/malate metabolism
LPQSTKTENEHGYGLLNIRKVAHKYFGEIDITQKGNEFKLGIMLMLE